MGLAYYLVLLGIAAVIPAAIAASKGRSFWGWWVYGYFLWIIALIHAFVVPPTGRVIEDNAIAAGNLKCPSCAEYIKRDAKVCRYCGRDTGY